jgi:hypothetical protein
VKGAGVGDALMRPMFVVELLELAQRVEEVSVVPGGGAVEEFVAAGLYPPAAFGRGCFLFHDRVSCAVSARR